MADRLQVSQLRVTYGNRIVIDVAELSVAEGELLVVVGGAGSGKSTLGAALAGGVPSRGELRIDGRLLDGTPSQRRRQGLAAALRDAGRISGCTVVEVLRLASQGSDRSAKALERFWQLGARERVPAQHLSGGEQQLLRVAAAWCASPLVLVLDSPTVGLASDAAATVGALAREEAERGAAVVWLEQDPRAAPAAPKLQIAGGKVSPITSPA
jgi:branched-chain amino acid transport system ATP-binding protein